MFVASAAGGVRRAVEELHGLSGRELQKRREGARVLRRHGHEPLDFVAELEGFEYGFLRFGSGWAGSGHIAC